MKPAILITRSQEDSLEFASAVETLGYQPVIEPLISIEKIPFKYSGLLPKAIIATSSHALVRNEWDDVPFFVMGERSAVKARELGYSNIVSSKGEFDVLISSLLETVPENSPVLYLRGETIRHDLKNRLPAYKVEEVTNYKVITSDGLSESTKSAIQSGQIDVVTLFSSNTAAIFLDLVTKAAIEHALKNINLLSLSPAVLESVKSLPWGRIQTAHKPDSAGMLAILKTMKQDHS